MPTLVPQVSITQAAGKVKMGCISAKRRLPKLTTTGSWSYISDRQLAIGVRVFSRIEVIIWTSAKRTTTRYRLGQTLKSDWSGCSISINYLFINIKFTRLIIMMEILGFDDNKKIGLFLLVISGFLYFFGIVLLFSRSLLLLSNILFLLGLYLFAGIAIILKFFTKRGNIKGSICYFSGFTLIVLGAGFLGAILQIVGFFLIFRAFLPDFYDYICHIRFIGPYLKSYYIQNALDRLAGNMQNRI